MTFLLSCITVVLYYSIALFLSVEFVSSKDVKIAGGKPVEDAEKFPFFIQLWIGYEWIPNQTIPKFRYCGATYIHEEWILTAAHCLQKKEMIPLDMFEEGFVRAYIGSEKIVEALFPAYHALRYVEKAYFHPRYRYEESDGLENIENDIVLGLLEEPFIISPSILPVSHPDSSTVFCKKGIIIGTGISDSNTTTPEVIRYSVVKPKSANETITPPPFPKEKQFYTEVEINKGHPLDGDSGGPMVCAAEWSRTSEQQYVVYGVISKSYNTSSSTVITSFESVDKHMKFIEKYVNFTLPLFGRSTSLYVHFLCRIGLAVSIVYSVNNL